MNILLVNHLLDPHSGGGTAERTLQLARFLAFKNEKCTVLALNIGLIPKIYKDLGTARLKAIPCLNRRYFIPYVSLGQIRRWITKSDLVYLSGHWTLLNAMVYLACRQLKKPYLFCPAGALNRFGRSHRLKIWYERLVGKGIINNSSLCIAITLDERKEFLERGVPVHKIVVLPNGVDPNQYTLSNPKDEMQEFRSKYLINQAPYILFLGRLNKIKGPDLLLEAFASVLHQFPDYLLVMAGPDEGLMTDLLGRAKELGISSKIRFPGFLSGTQKTAALMAARLLVIPSRHDAMSIVVLEAGICGCPVMFTDKCGLSEVLGAGAGIQTEVSKVSIEKALSRFLGDSNSLDLLASLLKNLVNENYLWSLQAQRFIELAHSVVDGE